MIKICFYSHTIDYAGTWRSHEKIIENLDRKIFDPYIMYWDKSLDNNRLEYLKTKLDNNMFIPFSRSKKKNGPETGYSPEETNFRTIALSNNFDIIHFARSGYYEWPFTDRLAKLQIETNIFGARDNSIFLDRSIAISHVVNNLRNGSDTLIYNPIKTPSDISKNNSIRKKFNINDSDIVLGRIGRPDNFTPISLIAFKKLQQEINNIYYLIIGGCQQAKKFVYDNQINNIIFIDPTNDDEYLDLFNRNIDIFAHYRSDGETFGVAIATAMAYGLPIVSHYGGYNNQHITIKEGGYVANNSDEYYEYLKKLCLNKQLRKDIGDIGRSIVLSEYEEKKVTKALQNKYLEWLK